MLNAAAATHRRPGRLQKRGTGGRASCLTLTAPMLQVSGPGVSGGSAGAAVTFIVTLKDSTGKRITEGGAYVAAHVEPKSLAPKDEQVQSFS